MRYPTPQIASFGFVLSLACGGTGESANPLGNSGDAGTSDDAAQNNNANADAGSPGSDAAVCTPQCDGKACGDDGCGSACGTCLTDETCDPFGACVSNAPACPPEGPFGTGVGSQITNATLTDCDGNTHELHDLCSHRASWMFIFAGW